MERSERLQDGEGPACAVVTSHVESKTAQLGGLFKAEKTERRKAIGTVHSGVRPRRAKTHIESG